MKLSFDLTWLIVLFVILKLTGLIHISWLWLLVPGGLFLALCLAGALLGLLGAALASYALKTGKIKITRK